MSKRARNAEDARQGWLFGAQAAQNAPPRRVEHFDTQWRQLMNAAITESGKSRADIVAEMEQLLGEDPEYPVSKAMLDAWTGASRTGWRFPVIYLPAFMTVTGAYWLLDGLAKRCGRTVVTNEQVLAAELGQAIAEEERIKQRRRELQRRLKARRP